MKITLSDLKKIIKEEIAGAVMDQQDSQRFLHGAESGGQAFDDEAGMAKSQLFSMKQMAEDLCGLLESGDQLPAWAQSHVAVAHENLRQVHGYIVGDAAADSSDGHSTQRMSEAYSRITTEELNAWKNGDWGFNSSDVDETQYTDD